jgi:hypothetical protein
LTKWSHRERLSERAFKPMQTKEQRKAWLQRNRQKMSKYQKKYVQKTDSYRRAELNRHLVKSYGITIERKQEMWDEQGGLCSVCANPLPDILKRDCQVDHCHSTGTVRGLLHWYCNVLVGVMENHPTLIGNIDRYLKDAIVRTHGK